MTRIKCILQAPRQPIPELAEFLAQFQVHFDRKESQTASERYLSGLLTEHPNENCDTLASIPPGTSAQSLQGLLTTMVLDENDLNRQRVQVMTALPTEGDGVLIFDDTGLPSKGKPQSAWPVSTRARSAKWPIARSRSTLTMRNARAWPVATRLYLPKECGDNPNLRRKARIPETVPFQTKAEIALDLLDQANTWGVRHTCVAANADYGDNPRFLDGLEKRRERYVAGVRANFQAALSERTAAPIRVDQALATQPARARRTIYWQEGSQGWWRARFAATRCWRVDGKGRRTRGWLIGQRPPRGETGDAKNFWSNWGAHTSVEKMVEYAHRRHWVQQYHEEAKGELSWDQYQGRRWQGFHRNAVLVMLGFSFLVWQEWQERQRDRRVGRPRRACSPSAA